MKPIHEVLAPMNMPVCHPPYTGAESEFVTYTLINNAYDNWASGSAVQEQTVYAVDLFTMDEYEDLAEQIKALLRGEGYVVQEGPEFYEPDTKYHHISFDVTCYDGVNMYAV